MTVEIHSGEDWERLYGLLLKKKGVALVLGMSDSGKSTLIRYLTKRFLIDGIPISLVDSDIGQSSLGLPGTVSMRAFHKQTDFESFRYQKMSFLGTVNPVKVIPSLIQTASDMVDVCRRKTELVLIDTTGLAAGCIGRVLKTGKIRAIRPDWIITIQKKDELEHILQHCDPERIIRIRRSPGVKTRSRETRFQYRNMRLKEYFSPPGSEYGLRFNGLKWFSYGQFCSPMQVDIEEGLILGLNYNRETAGLGIVTEAENGIIVIRSPLKTIQQIRSLVTGDITLSQSPVPKSGRAK